MMPVRDTSREVYHNEVKSNLSMRQLQVYLVFQDEPSKVFTDKDLCKATGLAINCITPRRGELEKLEYIIDIGKVLVATGNGKMRYVHGFKLNPQRRLF